MPTPFFFASMPNGLGAIHRRDRRDSGFVLRGCGTYDFYMATSSLAGRSRIDEFLPTHDFAARYDIRISAPPATVYRCLLRSDFNQVWIVRFLISLRSGRWIHPNHEPTDLHERLQGTGFVILSESPNQEIVIGVAGRFWRPNGGRHPDLEPGDFTRFSRAGYAKAVWNFLLQPATDGTILSTETRIQCLGRGARWKFRLYWTVISPSPA